LGISCEKSRFYTKNSYCFQLRREARKLFGVFRVINHDFTQKNHIFSNFRGGRAPSPSPPPPGSAPGISVRLYLQLFVGGRMSYLSYLYLNAYSGVQHILFCGCFCLVYHMLPVSLCYLFLIASLVFSNVYLQKKITSSG
jgi:hypothetical protein